MAKKDKVSITYMLNQSKSWKDNHKVTVESKGKTPTVTLAMIYDVVMNMNTRLGKLEQFQEYVLDVFKRNNLK